ncbi:ABC transporter substrate-binding protein [Actinomyces sp. B33]|uniref:ABC transporter substrate-binding protein n=1 Tax=Actinomyces sp. B33 TaxID=2942131 RepID=UPI0023408C6B|nr:ABC transporter substrate-binding protein [Actinomyces sp. B33]MDC4233316.1 ABC transporter substrate-binding protein [Actinomyces sp. B33]
MTRLRPLVALLALGWAVLVGCAPQPADPGAPDQSGAAQSPGTAAAGADADAVTIGLTYIPNVQFSPVYVAEDHGLYAAEGLDATIRHHGSDEGLFTALVSGQEDVVIASGDEAMTARDQGMDLVSIGAYYRTYPGAVIVPADSPIRSLADLEGRSIGIPGEYGSNWYATLAAIQAGGLTAEDVDIVSIGYTQQAAIAQGQVDAVLGFTNNDLVQMRRAGLDVRAIDLAPGDVPLVGASIITTRQWLDAHPDEAAAVVRATAAGIDATIADPQSAIDATRTRDETLTDEERLDTARAVLDETIRLMRAPEGQALGEQDLAAWEAMADFLASIPGLVQTRPDAEAAAVNLVPSR